VTDERVAAHVGFHLGEGSAEDVVDGVAIWRHERPEFVSFATQGLSDQPITAVYPQELVCSVEHGQDGAAAFLIRLTLQRVLNERRGLVNNQIIRNDQPLLANTLITGVMAGSHPYLDDSFNVVFDDQHNVVAEIMTLIPLTGPEIARADTAGIDALIDTLEQNDPPLLDVTRSSA
jgi:hypothetical protein